MLADVMSSTACDERDRTRRTQPPVALLSRKFRRVRAMQVAVRSDRNAVVVPGGENRFGLLRIDATSHLDGLGAGPLKGEWAGGASRK